MVGYIPANKGKMAGIIPAQVREPSYSGPIVGASIQRDVDSPISTRPLGRVHPGPREVQDGIWDYGTEVQRSSAQSQAKRKTLIFGEV